MVGLRGMSAGEARRRAAELVALMDRAAGGVDAGRVDILARHSRQRGFCRCPRADRRRAYRQGVPWGPMEELASLFAPGMKHVQEEKQRLAMTRDDDATGDPPSTVDLDGNRAVIRLPRSEPPAAPPPAPPREVRAPEDESPPTT